MRFWLLVPALLALVACGGTSQRATFTCPNGPDLVVDYEADAATLTYSSGQVERLPATATPAVYAKPGIVWQSTGFRSARLTDGPQSYACDQMAG